MARQPAAFTRGDGRTGQREKAAITERVLAGGRPRARAGLSARVTALLSLLMGRHLPEKLQEKT